MNNKWTLRELQLLELDILKEFVNICDKNGLTYYIIGGTLLGAVRHKGFIPWDDDIDVAMPREDYEKYLKISDEFLKRNLKNNNYRTNPNFHYCITRIIDTNRVIKETRNKNEETFISIDIFPIDGTPNNYFIRKIYYLKIMIRRAILSLCYKDCIDKQRKRNIFEKIIIFFGKKMNFNKIFSVQKQKQIIDKKCSYYKISKSKNIGTIMGAYRTREIVPKEYFGDGKLYEFEGMKLRGPKMYDKYLTHMYGDYMTPQKFNNSKMHYEVLEE